MSPIRCSAERLIAAPPEVVYHCIADYREHHRPGGFLPPAFSDMRIEHGGVGAGTVFTVTMTLAGQSRPMTAEVTEPEPGRVLVERSSQVWTTFIVEPAGEGQCRVRFDTLLAYSGLEGLVTRLLAPRLLRSLYADELARLERYAQAHPPLADGTEHRHTPPLPPA